MKRHTGTLCVRLGCHVSEKQVAMYIVHLPHQTRDKIAPYSNNPNMRPVGSGGYTMYGPQVAALATQALPPLVGPGYEASSYSGMYLVLS